MAIWAYECRPCGGSGVWLVSREWVDGLPVDVNILRVKTGAGWACAVVDRNRPVAVEAMLLRDATPSGLHDCPECAPLLATAAALAPAAQPVQGSAAAQLQAAAISLQGRRMLVVLVGLDVAQSAGEADMLIADLSARFGGADVVLVAQHDDGTPHFHGDAALVGLVADVPIDKMPWKTYPLK